MILSPNQQKVVDELISVAEVALDSSTKKLPIHPRTHSLICAPSGAGKSHLMKALGELLDVPVLHLNVSTWAPFGSKNKKYTWNCIVEFIEKHPKGIIVLDEIDKIDSEGDWQGYIRLEIHDLLDAKVPQQVEGSSSSSDIW